MTLKQVQGLMMIVLLFALSGRTFSQTDPETIPYQSTAQGSGLKDGEELFYDVYYSFINIGYAKFTTKQSITDKNVFTCSAILKSNDALPFVYVNYEFVSEMRVRNDSIIPQKFTALEFKEGKQSVLNYDFKYDSGFVTIFKKGFDGSTEIDKKISLATIYQDGLSIFYCVRQKSMKKTDELIPVIMYSDSSALLFRSQLKKETVDIAEYDDVASVKVDGFEYFTAVFGLTGDFEAWFSDDAARVPLKAKLKVKIGNVTLELNNFKRKDWKISY